MTTSTLVLKHAPLRRAQHLVTSPMGCDSNLDDRTKAHRQQLDAVVRQHGRRLLAVARRYFACEADCADAVQDALTAAVRHLPRFHGRCRLETWLHRIVVNACLMKLRAQSRRPTVSVELDELPIQDHHAGQTLWSNESRTAVRDALRQLSEPQRTVIQLRYFDGFNTAETAELLGLQPAAVKTRLHRSCRALRRLLPAAITEV